MVLHRPENKVPSQFVSYNIPSSCLSSLNGFDFFFLCETVYNYPPKGRWIVVDIYRDAKRRGIYPPLLTNPEGDSCFSVYQIRRIKKCRFINGHNFFFWNFRETTRHFSLSSQNEYPRIFQVTRANQNARKLLSTDLVNTKSRCIYLHQVLYLYVKIRLYILGFKHTRKTIF